MNRLLATFENAWRVASVMADKDERDYALIRTNNPQQPYIVELHQGQEGAIALITSDADSGLRWISRKRHQAKLCA